MQNARRRHLKKLTILTIYFQDGLRASFLDSNHPWRDHNQILKDRIMTMWRTFLLTKKPCDFMSQAFPNVAVSLMSDCKAQINT